MCTAAVSPMATRTVGCQGNTHKQGRVNLNSCWQQSTVNDIITAMLHGLQEEPSYSAQDRQSQVKQYLAQTARSIEKFGVQLLTCKRAVIFKFLDLTPYPFDSIGFTSVLRHCHTRIKRQLLHYTTISYAQMHMTSRNFGGHL